MGKIRIKWKCDFCSSHRKFKTGTSLEPPNGFMFRCPVCGKHIKWSTSR